MVSVVIATWNTAHYLQETVESALAQTWPRVEIIVVDDGSTDDTEARVAPFGARIRYLRREHGGLAAARNAGVAAARGEFIALLDADDLWEPHKLAVQVDLAVRLPESGLIGCDGLQFERGTPRAGRLVGGGLARVLEASETDEVTGDFHAHFIGNNPFSCPAQTLIPRRVLDEIGPFRDCGVQDYDCYLRIAQRYPVTLHRHRLAYWRYRADSMSGPQDGRQGVWDRWTLPMLMAHAIRCSPDDRRLVEQRCTGLVRSLAYHAYHDGGNGNRGVTRELAGLFRTRPWPPAALPYLVASLAPAPVRTAAARTRQMARRWKRWGAPGAFGRIERLAPGLDDIVPSGARIERVAEGFGCAEGPVWMPEGHLLFGDLPQNVIRRWHPDEGDSIVRTRTGYSPADVPPGPAMGSNGMTLDATDRLLICEPGNRRVTRQEADGSLTVLADRYEGKRLNSPNDLVCRSDGILYFTDPPHGLPGEDTHPGKELPFNGFYRLVGGQLELLSDAMSRPNGIAFSPDERWLYVTNSDPKQKVWMRYAVADDGRIERGTVLLDLTGEPGQPPDGMKVDIEGNLYLTGPGGLWIVSPAGAVLGRLRTELEPSNCAWGDADGRTLYLTAVSDLYRIRLKIPGVRPGSP